MRDSLLAQAGPAIPPEVTEFAAMKGVSGHLNAVIDLARRAFPGAPLVLSLARDAEDHVHQYIALDIEATDKTAEELLSGQRIWSSEIGHICSSRHAVHFVLGWR